MGQQRRHNVVGAIHRPAKQVDGAVVGHPREVAPGAVTATVGALPRDKVQPGLLDVRELPDERRPHPAEHGADAGGHRRGIAVTSGSHRTSA